VHIHIFGASGSGTTTLGRALASELELAFLDADDFFWEQTEPPFREKKDIPERQAELATATKDADSWVLSGSVMGWGDFLIPEIDLAVYLYLRPEIRLARLLARERERNGDRIAPGGDMRASHEEFMAWAGRYDTAGLEQRSKASHAEWMLTLSCELLVIEGEERTREKIAQIIRSYRAFHQ
jgi:adenylate kinase family enzyme